MAKTDGNYTDFIYDANGNRIAANGNNYATTYNYDFENRLTRVDEHNGKALEYAYDGDGNMIKRSDLQPNPNGLAIALYLYDINNSLPESSDLDKEEQTLELLNSRANSVEMSLAPVLPDNPLADTIKPNLNTNLSQVLAVYNGNTGSLDADYTYGLDRIAVHDEDTSTGKVQDPLYYLYDGMGRVTELTKPTAQVSDKYRFDAFGVELPGGKMSPNAYKNLNNPFGYNGEMYDPEAGLSYMRNRNYEPETGRFTTRDQLPGHISEPLSMNAYAYVSNNPIQFVDPLGLEKKKRSRIRINGVEVDLESGILFKAGLYASEQVEGVDITRGNGLVIDLNASEFGYILGHEAIVTVDSNRYVSYYSFSPGKSILDSTDNVYSKKFNIDSTSIDDILSVINKTRSEQGLDTYDRIMIIDGISESRIDKINEFAESTNSVYRFLVYNCGDFVQEALNAGGIENREGFWPDYRYMKMKEEKYNDYIFE